LKIGLLLPLTGEQSGFGQSVIRAMECAAQIKNDTCSSAVLPFASGLPDVEIVSEDTQSRLDTIEPALAKLKAAGVMSVLGPLAGPASEIASEWANREGVPLIALTQKNSNSRRDSRSLSLGYPLEHQVSDILKQLKAEGHKHAGLFYPKNPYGEKMRELFLSKIHAHDLEIVVSFAYDPQNYNTTTEVRSFQKALLGSGRASQITAMIFPDTYRSVNQFVPAFHFSNLGPWILAGTNTWNDSRLDRARLVDVYPGSFFVDFFDARRADPLVEAFVEGYSKISGHTPNTLEATGFDAMWYARHAARELTEFTHDDLSAALTRVRGFRGVTMLKRLSTEGAELEPRVMTINPSNNPES
jgi:ABC-type branched-subunit amino acid transport system substrate-binding protein